MSLIVLYDKIKIVTNSYVTIILMTIILNVTKTKFYCDKNSCHY